MLDVETVEDPAAAAALMDPLRARILSELTEPRSAANLAQRIGLTRQKVNYHLRALEERGVHVILCKTCLDHLGLAGSVEVGTVGGMGDIIAAQWKAGKVIPL